MKNAKDNTIAIAVIGAAAIIIAACIGLFSPVIEAVVEQVFSTPTDNPLISVSINTTPANEQASIDANATDAGSQVVPVITASSTPRSTGFGCFCVPENCAGAKIYQGDTVPASSIIEPPLGSRGNLYVYLDAGVAEVTGVLWAYVDDKGAPASKSCLDSQLIAFDYTNLIYIGE